MSTLRRHLPVHTGTMHTDSYEIVGRTRDPALRIRAQTYERLYREARARK